MLHAPIQMPCAACTLIAVPCAACTLIAMPCAECTLINMPCAARTYSMPCAACTSIAMPCAACSLIKPLHSLQSQYHNGQCCKCSDSCFQRGKRTFAKLLFSQTHRVGRLCTAQCLPYIKDTTVVSSEISIYTMGVHTSGYPHSFLFLFVPAHLHFPQPLIFDEPSVQLLLRIKQSTLQCWHSLPFW